MSLCLWGTKCVDVSLLVIQTRQAGPHGLQGGSSHRGTGGRVDAAPADSDRGNQASNRGAGKEGSKKKKDKKKKTPAATKGGKAAAGKGRGQSQQPKSGGKSKKKKKGGLKNKETYERMNFLYQAAHAAFPLSRELSRSYIAQVRINRLCCFCCLFVFLL